MDTVKNLVGLQAVSQVWEASPAWYVWMSDAHGVYKFQLVQAEQLQDRDRHLSGIFAVKCFPYPHSNVFKTFSPEEKELRTSSLFDATHTPTFDHLDQLPEDAFNVAVIECDMHTDGIYARFTLESLSTLRTVDAIVSEGGPQAQRRDVPGWRLGGTFFNWLLAVYAYGSRTVPTRIQLRRSQGFETVQTSGLNVVYRDRPDIHCYTATVDFGQVSGSQSAEKHLQEQGDVLLDCKCPDHEKPPHALFEPVSDLFPLNELWWSLADADYPSHLGSTCGCSGHHDHSHHCHTPAFSAEKGPSRIDYRSD